MKKVYKTPTVERIEFDYQETVAASRWPWCCYGQSSSNSGTRGTTIHPTYGQQVTMGSNPTYTCMSSLAGSGFNGVHTSNVGYICGQH